MSNFYGYVVFVLHAHIPYVLKHDRMDEEWLYEAMAETYIPLLNILKRLDQEKQSPKIVFSFSPVLLEQLVHPHFKYGFKEYCRMKANFAEKDEIDFKAYNMHRSWLAGLWKNFYLKTLDIFEKKYNEDIVAAFRELQDKGQLEVIISAATHSYLSLLSRDVSISAQIKMAIKTYEKMFWREPSGIWLPECGYRPAGWWKNPLPSYSYKEAYWRKGIEEFLDENDLYYFIIDQNQLMKAAPYDLKKTPFDTYYLTTPWIRKRPVTVFSRDIQLSRQVWEHHFGYPGDAVYLDFHKKHLGGWLRYWKITDPHADLQYKHDYYPDDAFGKKVLEHAGHYKWLIKESLKNNYYVTGEAKIVCIAFDAELFGHWWFEGPMWLYYVLKWINMDPEIKLITCSEYIQQKPAYNYISLPESSWGKNYDSSTWINPEVYWVWEKVYDAENEMFYLANHFINRKEEEPLKSILRQIMRELLLLQASDWEFMITNWSTRDHAEARASQHHSDFRRLAKLAWDYGQGKWIDQSEWDFLGFDKWLRDIFEPELNWYL